jgi:hypothetical protein
LESGKLVAKWRGFSFYFAFAFMGFRHCSSRKTVNRLGIFRLRKREVFMGVAHTHSL